ncbi:Disulfide bond formation protein D precursor [Desulfuromonas sp. DDH964]|uniref:thioredoxin domain-containing protein n=1 Tax=Desulfuromonas sp. DDH964 TaxID=1823759 RepID=UPI00078D9EAA|nr:thioredoxin domain-containing protein [Desulfuromonas sp. DDH964]AMV70641.1 Disulfide bond formation protein D precursor [Desulfuromonas sp. DDH964]
MKKSLLTILTLLLSATSLLADSVDVRLLRSVSLGETPRQVVASADGQRIYVLTTTGQVQLYSADGQIQGRFEVGPEVTGITPQGAERLILQSAERQEMTLLALQPVVSLKTAGAPSLGAPDAPVEMVIFDDFECPYCAKAVPLLKQVLEAYPGKVKLVFKNFPLKMHKNARAAAAAALAAERQGKFWPLHDLLFENYNKLNSQKIRELAEQAGLDLARFDQDRNDPALQQVINADMQEGKKVGVRGTPTVFINGRRLQNRSMAGFKQMIDAELARQQTAKKQTTRG